MAEHYPEYGIEVLPPHLKMAEIEIQRSYGDTVSVLKKSKSLRKWGQRDSTDGTNDTEIWTSPPAQEVHVAGNQIDTISSSDAGDTQVVKIEGHTRSALTGDLTFVVQTATLQGQSKTTLSTPLHRVTRLYNTGTTDFTGTIQVYEDTALTGGVPTDTDKIHIQTEAGENQSEKAATSLSSQDYWIITHVGGSVASKTGNPIVDIDLQYREAGKVWRKLFEFTVATQGSTTHSQAFEPPVIIPPNADVRLVAAASTNAEVNGYINGHLAVIL